MISEAIPIRRAKGNLPSDLSCQALPESYDVDMPMIHAASRSVRRTALASPPPHILRHRNRPAHIPLSTENRVALEAHAKTRGLSSRGMTGRVRATPKATMARTTRNNAFSIYRFQGTLALPLIWFVLASHSRNSRSFDCSGIRRSRVPEAIPMASGAQRK